MESKTYKLKALIESNVLEVEHFEGDVYRSATSSTNRMFLDLLDIPVLNVLSPTCVEIVLGNQKYEIYSDDSEKILKAWLALRKENKSSPKAPEVLSEQMKVEFDAALKKPAEQPTEQPHACQCEHFKRHYPQPQWVAVHPNPFGSAPPSPYSGFGGPSGGFGGSNFGGSSGGFGGSRGGSGDPRFTFGTFGASRPSTGFGGNSF